MLIEFAARRIASHTTKGARDAGRNARKLADAIYAQQGLCWYCGERLEDAQLDRLATGRTLGLDCICADHCRCGYLEGNLGAAHPGCHVGSDSARENLTDPELVALADRFVPTREAMEQARRERREDRGREASDGARRLGAARARAR